MLPDEQIVHTDVAEACLVGFAVDQAEPVLGGDDVLRVYGAFGTLQRLQEDLPLLHTQRHDVLPFHRRLAEVAVRPHPAELTLATVVTSEVT